VPRGRLIALSGSRRGGDLTNGGEITKVDLPVAAANQTTLESWLRNCSGREIAKGIAPVLTCDASLPRAPSPRLLSRGLWSCRPGSQ
jgi:hypothetical protein